MGLTILHSADWHLDSPFSTFSGEQRQLLRREQSRIPAMISRICREKGCDLVLLCGDLFDGTPSRDAVEEVKRALKDCGVPVMISPGNHDHCGAGSVWRQEVWPENVHIFTEGLESLSLPELDCRIYGAGYSGMECPGLLEGFRKNGPEACHIAVLHGDPVNRNSSYCPITAAQIRDSGLDYLALGHIHQGGSLIQGQTLCVWPGCPMGRGWDETGEKGVCIVSLGEQVQAEFVPLPLPEFFDLETEEDPRKLLPGGGSDDFYRVTLTGEPMDLAALVEALKSYPNLELRDRTRPPLDIWADLGGDTLRGVYFRLLWDLAGEDSTAELAAELSAGILAGREVRLP